MTALAPPADPDELMRWYRCGRKRAFSSYDAAGAEVERAHPTRGCEPYPCPYADHWHVGHKPTHAINAKTRRRARQLWVHTQDRTSSAA